MKSKLSKWIKNKDMFGHVPQLNFTKDEPASKTLIGGIVSLIVTFMLLDIISDKFIVMITKDNNNISSYTAHYDVETSKGIDLNKTELFTYHVLRK